MLTKSIFILMYLSRIIQKKEAMVRDKSMVATVRRQWRLCCRGAPFTVAWGDHQISTGTKPHIFAKFEAFCIQWYHFQLKIPIRHRFNRILKTLKYFPASADVMYFGATKMKIINIYNPCFRSHQIFKQYESGTYFKGFCT